MPIGDDGAPGRHPDEADLAAALGLDLHPAASSDEAARPEVRAHLAGCVTCQRRARAVRAARAGLAILSEHDQDELSARRLEQRLLAAWAAETAGEYGSPTTSDREPSVYDPGPITPRAAPAVGPARARAWRRRVTAWAAAAVLVAAGTAAAAVALDRWAGPRAEIRDDELRQEPAGPSSVVARRTASSRAEVTVPRRAFPGVGESPGARASNDPAVGPPRTELRRRAPTRPASSDPSRAAADRRRAWPEPRAAEVAPSESSSSPGETSVSVLSEPSDYVRALRAAEQAFYARRDLAEALSEARRARDLAVDRPQARRAERLACDALIAWGRAEDAVAACARLLDDPNPEQVRMTHYALGSLLRGRLGDCDRARPHFDAAVVFGHSSLYATDARLQRATCALQQRDFDQVERDLRILRTSEGLRDLSREVDQLERELSRAREATSTKDHPGPAR